MRTRLATARFSACAFFDRESAWGRDTDGDLSGADIAEANFDAADLRRAELQDFDLSRMASYQGMKVSLGQQASLLRGLGIRVFPD